MPKPLTADFVKRVTKPGRHYDGRGGNGLALNVKAMKSSPQLSKSWVQRLRINGLYTSLGLGRYPLVTLSQARTMALKNARLVNEGIDPRIEKSTPTFGEASEKTLTLQNHKNPKSGQDWRSSIQKHCKPILSAKVDAITGAQILDIIAPLWTIKHETARALRSRINQVFQYVIAQGYRTDNPVDALKILPRNGNGSKSHHKSLPYSQVPAALDKIKKTNQYKGLTLALEFLILTAARSGEVRQATWNEIDLEKGLWVIPGERMKAGRPHRIPLSTRALAVLNEARSLSPDLSGLIFPSVMGATIAARTLSQFCRKLELGSVPHGFRASFRTWSAEQTNYPRELAEIALSHAVGDAVEQAYQRSDLVEQRRAMMQDWADFLTPSQA